jgi:multidrug efflux pump subunit AcrA (membrane-fusion protein)
VQFSVPEDKVAAIKTGQKVLMRPWAQSAELKGRVREVAASADALSRTSPASGLFIDHEALPPLVEIDTDDSISDRAD